MRSIVTTEADVVIVGGGIIGCLLAREIIGHAAEASVALIERDTVGGGATRRSAGLHLPRGGTRRVREMAAHSHDYYERLKQAHPQLPIYPVGLSIIAEATAAGLAEAYLPSAKLTQLPGIVGADAVSPPPKAQVFEAIGAQYADVYALTQFLARQLRQVVTFFEGTGVRAIAEDAHGAELTLGTGTVLRASRVVLAPGPWLGATAWRDLLSPLGMRVKKVAALHIEQPVTPDDKVICFEDEDAFLLPRFDRGHWLYSYTCPEWDVDPDVPLGGLSSANLAQAREILCRYAPELAPRCLSGRVFCDAYSGTGEPRVQRVGDGGRIVFAGAANGSGYRLAPAIAARAIGLLNLTGSEG